MQQSPTHRFGHPNMPQLNNSQFLDTAEVDLPSDDGGVVMTQAKKMQRGESTSSKTKERAAVEVFLPSDDEGMVMTQAKKMRHGESTTSKTKEKAAVEEDLPSDDGSMVISNPNIKSKVSLKKSPN